LNGKYEAWIDNYTAGRLLIIQNDDLDFKNNPEDLGLIIEKVDAEIHGLF